jgi:integrase
VQKYLIRADLVDVFGEARLENIDKFSLQTHLNRLAQTLSRDRVLHARAFLKAIFAEAVDQDFIGKDPARTLKVPAHLKETDKTVLSWDQLRAVLSRLGRRDRILLELEMTNALRPSELFGLKWKCFDASESTIRIEETAYKGKIRSWGKTKGSLATIPIAFELSEDLQVWRNECREEQRHKKHWHGPETPLSAGHPHERRGAALSRQRDRRVFKGTRTGLHFRTETPVKWKRPACSPTQNPRNEWELRIKRAGSVFAERSGTEWLGHFRMVRQQSLPAAERGGLERGDGRSDPIPNPC